MKNIKKILFLGILALLCFCIAKPVLGATKETTSAAPLNQNVFDLITLSQNGQTLNYSNLKSTETNTYIIANDSITITTHPIDTQLIVNNTTDLSLYYVSSTTISNIEKNPDTNTYPDFFEYKGKAYYFRVFTGYLNVYLTNPTTSTTIATSTRQSDLIKYEIDPATSNLSITLVEGYTLKSSAPDTTFTFTNGKNNSIYNLNFIRPVVNFSNASNPILSFNTFETDDSGNYFPATDTIQKEQTFGKVQVEFLNNNYTANNPLFFDINYNGFVYSFELFSDNDLLYVNYFDDNNEENDRYLATKLIDDGSGNLVVDSNSAIKSTNASGFEMFSILFTYTGRYEIDVYDSTFTCGLNNSNHYTTSFYIKNEANSDFDNIYVIAQTLDEEGNEIEYVVNQSILNNSTKVTIKNMGHIENLSEVIEKISLSYVGFGQEDTIPDTIDYLPEQISQELNENGDFIITLSDDQYYEIVIYPKDTSLSQKKTVLTIVKQPKTVFKIQGVNMEATEPFKTYVYSDSVIINSPMQFNVKFSSSNTTEPTTTLNKTFINDYQITLGQLKISISKTTIKTSDENADTSGLHIQVQGVGDMIVTVTFNGEQTVYNLNSEKKNSILSFKEYGTYHIHVVDSMGYESSGSFSYEKTLNFSDLAIIILSVLLVTIIAVFILVARGKVKTR